MQGPLEPSLQCRAKAAHGFSQDRCQEEGGKRQGRGKSYIRGSHPLTGPGPIRTRLWKQEASIALRLCVQWAGQPAQLHLYNRQVHVYLLLAQMELRMCAPGTISLPVHLGPQSWKVWRRLSSLDRQSGAAEAGTLYSQTNPHARETGRWGQEQPRKEDRFLLAKKLTERLFRGFEVFS